MTFIFDGHTDLPSRLWESFADLGLKQLDRHTDLPRLREGGISGLVLALYLPPVLSPDEGVERMRRQLWTLRRQVRPGALELVTSSTELRSAAARGGHWGALGIREWTPAGTGRDPRRVCGTGRSSGNADPQRKSRIVRRGLW